MERNPDMFSSKKNNFFTTEERHEHLRWQGDEYIIWKCLFWKQTQSQNTSFFDDFSPETKDAVKCTASLTIRWWRGARRGAQAPSGPSRSKDRRSETSRDTDASLEHDRPVHNNTRRFTDWRTQHHSSWTRILMSVCSFTPEAHESAWNTEIKQNDDLFISSILLFQPLLKFTQEANINYAPTRQKQQNSDHFKDITTDTSWR